MYRGEHHHSAVRAKQIGEVHVGQAITPVEHEKYGLRAKFPEAPVCEGAKILRAANL